MCGCSSNAHAKAEVERYPLLNHLSDMQVTLKGNPDSLLFLQIHTFVQFIELTFSIPIAFCEAAQSQECPSIIFVSGLHITHLEHVSSLVRFYFSRVSLFCCSFQTSCQLSLHRSQLQFTKKSLHAFEIFLYSIKILGFLNCFRCQQFIILVRYEKTLTSTQANPLQFCAIFSWYRTYVYVRLAVVHFIIPIVKMNN